MKSLKQISDELGIDKQKVYRYVVRNNIKEAHQKGKTKQYDEAVEKIIIEHFEDKKQKSKPCQNHINEEFNDAFLKQLKTKDLQIEKLQQALDQEQLLHLQTKNEMKQLLDNHQQLLEYKHIQESKGFFKRLFGL